MIVSLLGLFGGIGLILLGNMLEGGHIGSLLQATAALIVFGGTLGATLLASTGEALKFCMGYCFKVVLGGKSNLKPLVKELVDLATSARREGLLSLDKAISGIKNPFLAENLRHVVDGYDAKVLQEMMEDRIELELEERLAGAKVFETAGGFAPTVGIIGAVLGLIHVMANLSDSSKLGAGIAVAFVATVYGVGSANLILLPFGTKAKKIAQTEVMELKVIMSGVLGIQAGLNPRVIEDCLNNLLGGHGGGHGGEGAAEKKAA